MSAIASVFIATSLDGFIARADGGLDWLDDANATVPAGEDCGYGEFMQSVDALAMGRRTYEKVRTFGPWAYGETPVIVLSRNPIVFPDEVPDCVTHSSESPRNCIDDCRAKEQRNSTSTAGLRFSVFCERD